MFGIQFFDPSIALIFFLLIAIGYLIFLDKEGVFQKKFLSFGPSSDTKFLHFTIDTWGKVIAVYFIGFISSLSTSYYTNVTGAYVNGVLLNPAYKDIIRRSEFWSKIIVVVDPIISWIMTSLQFFITLTMQLQFMIPQFIGHIIIAIPSNLRNISIKRFSFD
jgi:hypothetical protein